MLIRIFRYRESVRQTDARSLYEAELQLSNGAPDLELSVYSGEANELMQLVLEHYASAGNDPPRHASGMDVAAVRSDATKDPVAGPFGLLREAHHVLGFKDEADQLEFARLLVSLLATADAPAWSHEKSLLRAWLKRRLDDDDEEWSKFILSADEVWKKFPK